MLQDNISNRNDIIEQSESDMSDGYSNCNSRDCNCGCSKISDNEEINRCSIESSVGVSERLTGEYDDIDGYNKETTLESEIVNMLMAKGIILATAESCTGGLLASKIVSVQNASKVYGQGYITYSNKSKSKLLGVSSDTIKKYGAVSHEVALEMAKGAKKDSKSDIAIAITGIAGPEGGSKDKPVGMVVIGCALLGHVITKEYRLKGNRDKIRHDAAVIGLITIRETIMEWDQRIVKKAGKQLKGKKSKGDKKNKKLNGNRCKGIKIEGNKGNVKASKSKGKS